MAAKHLDDGGKVLAIGHSKEPQSIWRNPNCTLKCFRGSFLMVWVVLVMKDRDINCQMQSTSDTSCCIMITLPKRPILSSDSIQP